MEDDEEKKGRYWQRSTEQKSSRIMLIFVAVLIVMLIVVISMSVYGYSRYQKWKTRPKIYVNRGLFEFSNEAYQGEVNITTHVFLNNKGDEKSGELTLEWMIMESNRSSQNVYEKRGHLDVDPIEVDGNREVTFDMSLEPGRYVISYRTYEEGYFSYEGRQTIEVRESDLPDEKEGAEDERRPPGDAPSLSVISFLSIVVTFVILREQILKDRNRRKQR